MYSVIIEYLEKNFGGKATLERWNQVDDLPLFLRKTYIYNELHYYNRVFLLIDCSKKKDLGFNDLDKHINQIKRFASQEYEIILKFDRVTKYLRNKLISNKISFIVPGKQIFFPILGMIYSEKLVAKYKMDPSNLSINKMSPATQAVLIELVAENSGSFKQSDIAKKLWISRMSVSRAFRELQSLGILKEIEHSGKKTIVFSKNLIDTWKLASNYFINPKLKSVYVRTESIDQKLWGKLKLSGESALAEYSNMSEPKNKIYGISSSKWNKLEQMPVIEESKDVGMSIIEIWKHEMPVLDDMIHPLALLVLLKFENDERIIGELNNIEKEYFERGNRK